MGLFNTFGILGINARNLLYIRPFNKKKAIRFADDKLKSKHFLSARGIPVPKLYATIASVDELEKFNFSSLPDTFVLKPNMGFGGEGIIPIVGRKGKDFVKASGAPIEEAELREQISDILEGRYSISGLADTAFFEQLIQCDHHLAAFSYKGLPDIRIVVHNLIPVMAMLRLPTRESDGKANLHQGAVGVGIDLSTGKATHIVYRNTIVDEIPGIGPIRGFKIPYWDEILLIASRIQLVTNLGYLAADVALDEKNGPMLLEINARAGLSVQMANLAPLRKRLERIQGVQVNTPEKGVRVSQDLFGNKVEKEVKKISGKEVIGNEEQVKILTQDEARYVWAQINPILEESILDKHLSQDLGFEPEPNTDKVKLKLVIGSTRLQTLARLDTVPDPAFPLILGKRDLKDFLIDPGKGKSKSIKLPSFLGTDFFPSGQTSFTEIDEGIVKLDKTIKLLSHLKPINLSEEKKKFLDDSNYNPQLEYKELSFQPSEARKHLQGLRTRLDDSPLARLFEGKIQEIEKKINLLECRGGSGLTDASMDLYGHPTGFLLEEARSKLAARPAHFPSAPRVLSTEEGIREFERVLKEYGLSHWKIKVNRSMVAALSAGKSDTLFVREGAEFTEDRHRMLVAHEIETHILTAENGKYQPYRLFNRGFGDYLETQEGLAVWNQERVLAHDVEKNYRSAVLVFVVDFALKHGFAETYDYALKLGLPAEKALQVTFKVKRGMKDSGKGGAFTKELAYFSGYLEVRDFVANGGDLKQLYFGKYNLKDLPLILKVPGLKAPRVLPKFLR